MDHDPVRGEAERLVAAAIAAVSMAAQTVPKTGEQALANGSAECCICPVCRVISSMREPSPDLAERIAGGAGDLAAGVASLLRSFTPPGAPSPPAPSEGDTWWETMRQRARGSAATSGKKTSGDAWRAATADVPDTADAGPVASAPIVKKAIRKKTAPAARGPASAPAGEPSESPGSAAEKPTAKKVAKKAVKKAAPKPMPEDE